jgi:hypothetical protein
MSAVASCVTPIKGTHYRLTKLDSCGNPVTGTSSMVIVSKGFVQVQMAPQYQDGVEFFQLTADGSICVNQKDDNTLKRYELTIDFCEINQTGASWMTSMRELATGSPATGYGFAGQEGLASNRWSLEVWQKIAGAAACNSNGVVQYIYNAWPNVGGAKLGNYTIMNDKSTLQVTAETRAVATSSTIGWGVPPNQTSLQYLPSGFAVQATDHWYWNITTVAPPTPQCNPTSL